MKEKKPAGTAQSCDLRQRSNPSRFTSAPETESLRVDTSSAPTTFFSRCYLRITSRCVRSFPRGASRPGCTSGLLGAYSSGR